jgi:hypothetical protein
MFRSTARNLRSWWLDFSDDILGADLSLPEDAPGPSPLEYHLEHPHRQTLRPLAPRRAGTVAPRPAHCLCPVHASKPEVSTHSNHARHQTAR